MAQLFAVMRTRGPAWNDSVPMDEQVDWRRHAGFMNDLEVRDIAVLAGPLTGTRDALLVFRAEDEADVEARLAEDCWSVNGLLQTLWVKPWWLRLGTLVGTPTSTWDP
ncbi:MAG TPA: hypothetical protein VGM96_09075 [Reyranella sp.]|jgi:hypothetical protein